MTALPRKRASAKEIFGWAMFDFANQAYTLLIITVVFGALFTQVIVGDQGDDFRLGNLLWSLALAGSYFLVVLTAPFFGAVMDATAAKKRFLFVSYIVTIITTALLYFVAPGFIWLGVLLIVLSNYAYSIGESFIASFLPDLAPPEDLGKISGFGWALGYVGGLAAAGFTLLFLGEVSAENFDRIRWVGPFAAGFFFLAAIPTFLWVKERGTPRPLPAARQIFSAGYARVKNTLDHLKDFRDLAVFFSSLFFTMAGIFIIIAFTFIYGAQVIGWDEATRNIMFIVVQIMAAVGALGFGFLQDKIGVLRTYKITLGLWIAAIAAIYATPALAVHLGYEAQQIFLVVGTLAGLSLGSSQSAGRALVGLFSPPEKAAEFFGFWGVTAKLAACLGLLGLGGLQVWIGLQNAILFCVALFVVALVLSQLVDEKRGRQAAEELSVDR